MVHDHGCERCQYLAVVSKGCTCLGMSLAGVAPTLRERLVLVYCCVNHGNMGGVHARLKIFLKLLELFFKWSVLYHR